MEFLDIQLRRNKYIANKKKKKKYNKYFRFKKKKNYINVILNITFRI